MLGARPHQLETGQDGRQHPDAGLVTRRFRVPLLWSVLDHPGNSSMDQRIALVRRYLALFEPSSITLLPADREFIGAAWIKFLVENDIPFAIRVRQDLCVALPDASRWSIEALLRSRRARQLFPARAYVLPDGDIPVRLAAKRLKGGEWLIVMTGSPKPRRALQAYRKRWGIECLFGDAKTRGLNLEDTHLTDPNKIDTLTAILAPAMTWIYNSATASMGMKAIPRKTHGRRQKSWFRIGFDALRDAILNTPQTAAALWIERCPKRLAAS